MNYYGLKHLEDSKMVFKKKNKEDLPEYKEQKEALEKTENKKTIKLGVEATTETQEKELPGTELTPQELVLSMTDNDYRTEVLTLLSEIVSRLRMQEGEKELKKDK